MPDWKTLTECTISAYIEIMRESLVFLHHFRMFHLIDLNIKFRRGQVETTCLSQH